MVDMSMRIRHGDEVYQSEVRSSPPWKMSEFVKRKHLAFYVSFPVSFSTLFAVFMNLFGFVSLCAFVFSFFFFNPVICLVDFLCTWNVFVVM